MLKSVSAGMRAAVRQPWVAVVLWVWSAALALAAALPAGVWLSRGLSMRPRGDVLLQGFSFETLKELLHYDTSPVAAVLWWAVLGPVALAAVGSSLVNGGMLEVLWPREGGADPRPRLHRFFRGAGRFFLVNLRLLVGSSVLASIALVVVLAALAPVSAALEDTQFEALAWFGLLLAPLLVALTVIVWGTVLDFARLRVAATDGRGALAAGLWALRFVARHPVSSTGIWTILSLASLVAAAIGVALVPYVPTSGWPGVFALVFAQQALVFLRALLRVGTVAAEVDYAGPRRVGEVQVAGSVPAAAEPLTFMGEGL